MRGQYIVFCHVFDEQIRQYGETRRAAEETIRICRERGALAEYLEQRHEEVVESMVVLFDQKTAVEQSLERRFYEGRAEGRAEGHRAGNEEGKLNHAKATALNLRDLGGMTDAATVARMVGVDVGTVERWFAESCASINQRG